MNHWKRYLLAAVTCLFGLASSALVIAVYYNVLHNYVFPNLPAETGLPQYARTSIAPGLYLAAVYFSACLLPRNDRWKSSLISGAFVASSVLGMGTLLFGPASIAALAIPLALDMAPVIIATALAAGLHRLRAGISL